MAVQSADLEPRALSGEDAVRAERLGKGLAELRSRRRWTQAEAGERAAPPMTGQAWAKYENGRAPGIFRPSVQRRLVEAMGYSLVDLRGEVGRLERAGAPGEAPCGRAADEDWVARDFLNAPEAI